MYYTSHSYQAWEPTKAKTRKGAKAVASRRNPYATQNAVDVGIGIKTGDREYIERVSSNHHGKWNDYDY